MNTHWNVTRIIAWRDCQGFRWSIESLRFLRCQIVILQVSSLIVMPTRDLLATILLHGWQNYNNKRNVGKQEVSLFLSQVMLGNLGILIDISPSCFISCFQVDEVLWKWTTSPSVSEYELKEVQLINLSHLQYFWMSVSLGCLICSVNLLKGCKRISLLVTIVRMEKHTLPARWTVMMQLVVARESVLILISLRCVRHPKCETT